MSNETTRTAGRTVLTYGTFDLFHVGHVRLLRRLADLGDRLIVACSTDEFNTLKGKRTAIPYAHRVEVLEACQYVDLVIPETEWEQKPKDIKTYNVDLPAPDREHLDHEAERVDPVDASDPAGRCSTENRLKPACICNLADGITVICLHGRGAGSIVASNRVTGQSRRPG